MNQIVAPIEEVDEPSFANGQRMVWETDAAGERTARYVPLTKAQCLFPEDGDELVSSTWHEWTQIYLAQVMQMLLAGDPNSLVLSGTHVDFGVPGMGYPIPDIIVFRDVRDAHENWALFPVVQQGAKIIVAMELVSPHVRDNDVGKKLKLYHQAGVPVYIIVDQKKIDGPRSLTCYRRAPRGYDLVPLTANGQFLLHELGVAIAIEDNDVVCYELENGERIRKHQEEVEARKEAELTARIESEARVEAERKAKLESDARVEAERKAKMESDAAAAAMDRVRELEALVEKLKSGKQ